MGFRTQAPDPTAGYNRTTDWPSAGGGTTTSSGGLMSGFLGTTVGGNSSTWHPTIKWLMGFVLVELIAFHLLVRHLKL